MPVFCSVDDKLVPLYRIVWISELPHFCGDADCEREGQYEICLGEEESVWAASRDQHAKAVAALEAWLMGRQQEDDPNEIF